MQSLIFICLSRSHYDTIQNIEWINVFFISSLKDLALKIMLNNKLSQSLLVSVSLLILFSSSLQAQPITKDMPEEQHERIQEASSVTPITSVLEILNQRLYKPSELKELLTLIQSFPRPGIGQAQMAEQLNAYGINAFNQKDYSLAVKLFQRAAKANPAETSIWCNLAASSLETKDYATAQSSALQALILHPYKRDIWKLVQQACAQNNNDTCRQNAEIVLKAMTPSE